MVRGATQMISVRREDDAPCRSARLYVSRYFTPELVHYHGPRERVTELNSLAVICGDER